VPGLRVAVDGREWRSEDVALHVGSHYALAAGRIEAAPLLRVLGLSDRIGPDARDWLARADANVVLADVAMAGSDAAGVGGRARVESIRFAPVGDHPGLDGLGGELLADGHGL